jgi:peroxiredoxin Q/BCP
MTSVDTLETNTAFAEEHEANFPILSAPDKVMPETYGVLNERGMCNRWTYYIGTDGTVLKIDKETNPVTAGADLSRTMAELDFPRK